MRGSDRLAADDASGRRRGIGPWYPCRPGWSGPYCAYLPQNLGDGAVSEMKSRRDCPAFFWSLTLTAPWVFPIGSKSH